MSVVVGFKPKNWLDFKLKLCCTKIQKIRKFSNYYVTNIQTMNEVKLSRQVCINVHFFMEQDVRVQTNFKNTNILEKLW